MCHYHFSSSSGTEEEEKVEGDKEGGDQLVVGPTKDGMVPEEIAQTKPSWLYRFSKSPSPKDPETKRLVTAPPPLGFNYVSFRPSRQPFQLRERPEQVSVI